MADNLGYTEGSGKSIATDDVGGQHFQRIKIDQGIEGASAPIVASNAAKPSNFGVLGVGGEFNSVAPTFDSGDMALLQMDVNGNLKVTLATGIAGESWTYNRLLVEQNNTYSRKTADGQVLSGAGFLHSVTVQKSGSSITAGLLSVYDSTTETGTVIFTKYIDTDFKGETITINANVATGIYIGFDGTLAGVAATASYRAN